MLVVGACVGCFDPIISLFFLPLPVTIVDMVTNT